MPNQPPSSPPRTGTWCFFELPRELREPSERAERASEASEARAFCAFRLAVFKFGLTPEARRQCAPREKKSGFWAPKPRVFRVASEKKARIGSRRPSRTTITQLFSSSPLSECRNGLADASSAPQWGRPSRDPPRETLGFRWISKSLGRVGRARFTGFRPSPPPVAGPGWQDFRPFSDGHHAAVRRLPSVRMSSWLGRRLQRPPMG